MAALDPIAGISLEAYVDLCVKMKDCGGDLEICARIAEQNGVDRATWQTAMNGWNARMSDPSTAAEVSLAYMPLYQAALARSGPTASCSFEEYVGMSVMLNDPKYGLEKMYAHYGLDTPKWSQISTYWVGRLMQDPGLNERFGRETQSLIDRLNAGGPLPAPGGSAR